MGSTMTPALYQLPPADAFKHLTMGECTDNYALRPCHSVGVTPWNIDGGPLRGQAKSYAMVERNGSMRVDPFEMKLTYKFRSSGPGGTVDMRGMSNPQSAATALAYYHRRFHFDESQTPNLFNPYWRATLIGADRATPSDLTLTGDAATAWTALKSAGYAGER